MYTFLNLKNCDVRLIKKLISYKFSKCLQHARDDITLCNIVLRQIANTWFTRYWISRYTRWEKLLIWLLICTKNIEYDSYRLKFISKLLILIYLDSTFADKKQLLWKDLLQISQQIFVNHDARNEIFNFCKQNISFAFHLIFIPLYIFFF